MCPPPSCFILEFGRLARLVAGSHSSEDRPSVPDDRFIPPTGRPSTSHTEQLELSPTSYPRTLPALPTFYPVDTTSKLLFPFLPFGPNNQFRGFRDALVLARWLNRTLVVPPFFKHHTAALTIGESELVEVQEIFDWRQLASKIMNSPLGNTVLPTECLFCRFGTVSNGHRELESQCLRAEHGTHAGWRESVAL